MKICFFTIWREDSKTVGINMKIRNQVKAFANLGCESYFCVSTSSVVKLYKYSTQKNSFEQITQQCFTNKANREKQKGKITKKISSLFRLNECLKFLDEMHKNNGFNVIYMRRIIPFTGNIGWFIKKWSNSGCKIVWEIPTWGEKVKKLSRMLTQIQEEMMYKALRDKMQVVAISSGQPGRRDVLLINNGVDNEIIQMKKNKVHEGINMICLATFSYWHGYDRLLNGLKCYYSSEGFKKERINLYMVGNGYTEELKKQADELGISEYVHFEGVVIGEDLDALFDQMDVAVGNLGFFRKGVTSDTSIKIREYCARGIPFVTALTINDFPDKFPYVCRVPMDESYIDINQVVTFVKNQNLDETSIEMRRYSEENLTWEKQLKKVLIGIEVM